MPHDCNHPDHAHEATAATTAAKEGARKWYQFATHVEKDGKAVFNGLRTAGFVGGAAVAVGATYLLTRSPSQDRAQFEGNAQALA